MAGRRFQSGQAGRKCNVKERLGREEVKLVMRADEEFSEMLITIEGV